MVTLKLVSGLCLIINAAVVESFQPIAAGRRRSAIVQDASQSYHHVVSASLPFHHDLNSNRLHKGSSSSAVHQLHLSDSNYINDNGDRIDSLIYQTSKALRATSWFSWWAQVILTVVSSVTFLFARNVMDAQAAATPMELSKIASKFFLPGMGVVVSTISIVWTWGQRRLANRLLRKASTSRVEAANLLRRVIKVGVTLNLLGLLTSVLGAQYIVGTLVAKSMSNFVGFGGGAIGGGLVTSQTLQPLDVLVVQANTNVLSSHFVSLVCLLWLTRKVDLLDPPSLEDDDDV